MNSNLKTQVISFGCRLNIYESEIIKSHLNNLDDKDLVVFNTCAVTAEAERKAYKAIKTFKKRNPNKKIIVTGCAAQLTPDKFLNMPEVEKVIGNGKKLDLSSYENNNDKLIIDDVMRLEELSLHMIDSFEGKTRAFLQVQNGCDHRCTFCTIPFARGNSRSVAIGEIVRQVKHLVENGYKEIVLTGIDISDYGKNLPGEPKLGEMMKRLLKLVPELPRLRLSSIDVAEVDNDILDLIANEERFMPYMHISLQAGDDLILKRMKRRHSRQDIINFCNKIKELRPGIGIGADIIAGFPTENEEMFTNTLNIIKEAEIPYLHIFPYSKRQGTPAAKMPQVQEEIIKFRANKLIEEGKIVLKSFLAKMEGTKQKILIENEKNGNFYVARAENFAKILIDIDQMKKAMLKPGIIYEAFISDSADEFLHINLL